MLLDGPPVPAIEPEPGGEVERHRDEPPLAPRLDDLHGVGHTREDALVEPPVHPAHPPHHPVGRGAVERVALRRPPGRVACELVAAHRPDRDPLPLRGGALALDGVPALRREPGEELLHRPVALVLPVVLEVHAHREAEPLERARLLGGREEDLEPAHPLFAHDPARRGDERRRERRAILAARDEEPAARRGRERDPEDELRVVRDARALGCRGEVVVAREVAVRVAPRVRGRRRDEPAAAPEREVARRPAGPARRGAARLGGGEEGVADERAREVGLVPEERVPLGGRDLSDRAVDGQGRAGHPPFIAGALAGAQRRPRGGQAHPPGRLAPALRGG